MQVITLAAQLTHLRCNWGEALTAFQNRKIICRRRFFQCQSQKRSALREEDVHDKGACNEVVWCMIRVIASYTKSVTPLLVLPEITKGQETHRTCRQPCNAIFLGVSSRYRYGGWFKNPEKSSAFLEPPVCFFYPMNGLVQKQAKRLAHSIHWFIITIPIKIAISKLENAHSFICCPTPALENWPHLERDLG